MEDTENSVDQNNFEVEPTPVENEPISLSIENEPTDVSPEEAQAEEVSEDEPEKTSATTASAFESDWYKSKPFLITAAVLLSLAALAAFFIVKGRMAPDSNVALFQASPSPTASASPTASPRASVDPYANFASPKPSPSPSPSPNSSPVPSPTPAAANMYYQGANCDYTPDNSPPGTLAQDLNNKIFTTSTVPSSTSCSFIAQNSETTKTGQIRVILTIDDQKIEDKTFDAQDKGDWPNKNFITNTWGELIPKTVGLHTVKITINPNKTFNETNYDDNVYQARYTVTN